LQEKEAGRFIAIEAKFAEHPAASALRGMTALSRAHGPENMVRSLIACRTPAPYPLDKETHAIPGSDVSAWVDKANEWAGRGPTESLTTKPPGNFHHKFINQSLLGVWPAPEPHPGLARNEKLTKIKNDFIFVKI
jgi:hypothetical protein